MSDHHDDHGHEAPAPAPIDSDKRITYFGSTHTRGKYEPFGIRAVDRGKHMYVIGKTGMGKSTMLENLAIQDIQNGEGIAFIDPHGSTAEKLLDFVPFERLGDVVYFAPFDTEFPMGFNVMEDVGYDKRHLVVSGLMGAFKRIWVDAWSARMEYILQNVLLGLLEYPGSTLLDVNRMLTNKPFRAIVVENITDPIVKAFWTEEFAAYTDRYTQEATPAIQNKVGQFVSNPLVRNIVGQSKSTFDLRKMMDEKKIFIVNLSKGRMGETNASLLGSMLTVKIYLAAMSRADEPALRMQKLPRFYFYVDEFQSMMNEAFADILSESRKYKLALTLANQYIEQMEEKVRDAVFGNVGTMIVFRVGPFDAEVLKTIFEPTFVAEDLVGLGLGQIYLTLMIDGVGSAPFSAQTLPPIDAPNISYRNDVVTQSRANFATPREEVEKRVKAWQDEFSAPPKAEKKRDDRPFGGGGGAGPRPPQGPPPTAAQYREKGAISAARPARPDDRPVRSDAPRSDNRPPQSEDRSPRPDGPRSDDRPASVESVTHDGVRPIDRPRDEQPMPAGGFRPDDRPRRIEVRPRDGAPRRDDVPRRDDARPRSDERPRFENRPGSPSSRDFRGPPSNAAPVAPGMRDALKNAIAQVRAEVPAVPPKPPVSTPADTPHDSRSPLEILRAKQAQAPKTDPVPARPPTPRPNPQPAPQSAPRPQFKSDNAQHDGGHAKSDETGGVSEELIRRILSGKD